MAYPVDGNLLFGHTGEVSVLLEQVSQTHLLEVGDQVVVLLELKLGQHDFPRPSGRRKKIMKTFKSGLCYLYICQPCTKMAAIFYKKYYLQLLATVIPVGHVAEPFVNDGRGDLLLQVPHARDLAGQGNEHADVSPVRELTLQLFTVNNSTLLISLADTAYNTLWALCTIRTTFCKMA